MSVDRNLSKLAPASAETDSASATESGERRYKSLKEELEREHYGSYVMINIDTSEYVIAPTTSQVHAEFIHRFGEDVPGWCTRIGASVFATA
jgi:hypothetical protein